MKQIDITGKEKVEKAEKELTKGKVKFLRCSLIQDFSQPQGKVIRTVINGVTEYYEHGYTDGLKAIRKFHVENKGKNIIFMSTVGGGMSKRDSSYAQGRSKRYDN